MMKSSGGVLFVAFQWANHSEDKAHHLWGWIHQKQSQEGICSLFPLHNEQFEEVKEEKMDQRVSGAVLKNKLLAKLHVSHVRDE